MAAELDASIPFAHDAHITAMRVQGLIFHILM
jgi:hypothetical protein